MLKQFPITELIKAIQTRVIAGTGRKCLDHVERNEVSPFYYVEFRQSRPGNSKTMFVQDYTVYIHVITEKTESSVPMYRYIQELEEALTQDIDIPDPYNLVMQINNGVVSIYREETDELHGVVSFVFRISYGWKCKI